MSCSSPDLSNPALFPFLLCSLMDLSCTLRVFVHVCTVLVHVHAGVMLSKHLSTAMTTKRARRENGCTIRAKLR